MNGGDYDYRTIGTLCDDPIGLTCSMDAAKKWGRANDLVPYPTFEDAAKDVKTGMITAMLVPGAYPKIHRFIMDQGLKVQEVFLHEIPDLVLVGVSSRKPEHAAVLYHHPATDPLLPEVPIAFDKNAHVTSNSKACAELMANPDSSIAITNGLCAVYFKLFTYKILRSGIVMPFVCFSHN